MGFGIRRYPMTFWGTAAMMLHKWAMYVANDNAMFVEVAMVVTHRLVTGDTPGKERYRRSEWVLVR